MSAHGFPRAPLEGARREIRPDFDGLQSVRVVARGLLNAMSKAMNPPKRLTALVVDDDPISLEVTRRRLEDLDFEVTVREHSLGTSRWILENQPHLVLLDLVMPALTGAELAAVLQRSTLNVNVVLHSSKPQHELDKIARAAGVLGGISKDRNDAEFKRAILRFVRAVDGAAPETWRSP